tara:strand:- start:331 stop:1074 length:744 start_codon:yes stop_codon:yes gene_type:complete
MLDYKIQEARYILLRAKKLAELDLEEKNINRSEFKGLIMFSGGKDSIVASHLAINAIGVTDAFSETSLLQESLKEEIVKTGNSLGLKVSSNDQLPPKVFVKYWLRNLPPVKWKPSTLDASRHWKSIPNFAKKYKPNLMIFGRRLEENTIPEPIYKKKSLNIYQVHPIYNWTRSEVFDYMHKYDLFYPTCYKNGAKHLFTIVSLGQQAYKQTGRMDDVFDVWYKYGREYLMEAKAVDSRIEVYLKNKK